MDKLRIIDFLTNIKETEGEVLEADLICSCGNNTFKITHTGKQTKGILAAYITSKKRQLKVNAICEACSRNIIIYDSSLDGRKTTAAKAIPYNDFLLPKHNNDFWKINLKYNYYTERFKVNGCFTNEFEMFFAEIYDDDMKKWIRIIEE